MARRASRDTAWGTITSGLGAQRFVRHLTGPPERMYVSRRGDSLSALSPILLALFALAAASAVGRRLGRNGSLRLLDVGLVWIALVVLPAYSLAWIGLFTARNLAIF